MATMTIASYIGGSQLSQHILLPTLFFIGRNCEKIDAVYNLFQASWTREARTESHSFIWLQKQEEWLMLGDIVSVIATSILVSLHLSGEWILSLPIAFAVAGVAGGSVLIGYDLWNEERTPELEPERFDPMWEQIKFDPPDEEKLKQVLYVARILMNVALVVLSPTNPFFLVSAALEGYSLAQRMHWNWIHYTREIAEDLVIWEDFPNLGIGREKVVADRCRFDYHLLVFPEKKTAEEGEGCTICQEETAAPKYHFCQEADHAFHLKCLAGWVKGRADVVPFNSEDPATLDRPVSISGRRISHSFNRESRVEYDGAVIQDKSVTCPLCRAHGIASTFSVEIDDLTFGWQPIP